MILTLVVLVYITVMLIFVSWNKAPRWWANVFLIGSGFCFLSWESWMSLGVLNGDAVSVRAGKGNSFMNSIVMSLADGVVCVWQVQAALRVAGPTAFSGNWSWKALAAMLGVGVSQNALITLLFEKKLATGTISWAPLMPIQTPNSGELQNQWPWIIQPFCFYPLLRAIHSNIGLAI